MPLLSPGVPRGHPASLSSSSLNEGPGTPSGITGKVLVAFRVPDALLLQVSRQTGQDSTQASGEVPNTEVRQARLR